MKSLGLIVVALCESLPHPNCDLRCDWFWFHVETNDGKRSASGYTRGPESRAFKEARAVLKRLGKLEGSQRGWNDYAWIQCDSDFIAAIEDEELEK